VTTKHKYRSIRARSRKKKKMTSRYRMSQMINNLRYNNMKLSKLSQRILSRKRPSRWLRGQLTRRGRMC